MAARTILPLLSGLGAARTEGSDLSQRRKGSLPSFFEEGLMTPKLRQAPELDNSSYQGDA